MEKFEVQLSKKPPIRPISLYLPIRKNAFKKEFSINNNFKYSTP